MILRCAGVNCISPFQDGLYGYSFRVANQQKKLPEYARCTVCKTSIHISGHVAKTAIIVDDKNGKRKAKKTKTKT